MKQINKEPVITILMSTYNGEKYLVNQLYSLLQQTHNDWILYIRDDGSMDNTMAIIEKFMQLDKRIHLVQDNERNLGAGKSFWSLLKYSNSEYTIFCDQDDIWFERKLELMIAYANKCFNQQIPSLVYSNGFLYDDVTGVVTGRHMIHFHANSLKDFLFMNCGYHGCCSFFNRALLNKAINYEGYLYLHDDIISLIGHTLGRVYYLPKQLMLYRQHSGNVTGKVKKNKFGLYFFTNKMPVISVNHYKEKKQYFNYFKDQISPLDRKLFEEYFEYPKRWLVGRLWTILFNNYTLGGHFLVLLFKTILRKPMSEIRD